MTIASAIQAKQQQVADSYTAVSNKGGTLPTTQNLTNLATAISSIPSGGSSPVITSLSITPTTSAQMITVPSGTDGYSPVNVAAVTASIDANIQAGNIKKDVQILGVTGTYEGSGGGGGGYSELPNYQVVNGVASQRSITFTGNEFSDITSINLGGLSYAFYGCTGLTGLLNLSSLTNIAQAGLSSAFYMCTGLTSVNLSSLTSVGDYGLSYAFYMCTGLTSVDLSSLTSVDTRGLDSTFYGCTGLTSVNLSSLTSVGDYGLVAAFYSCRGLTGLLNLSSLTNIAHAGLINAFNGCTGLTSVNLSALTSVGDYGLDSAFYDCTGLTSVNLSSLTSVDTRGLNNAFYDCTSLTSVNLSSLTSVGAYGLDSAFYSCRNLTVLSFPALSSTNITDDSFYEMLSGCSNVTVHFPFDLESTMSSWGSVTSGFGGTNTTVLFDLNGCELTFAITPNSGNRLIVNGDELSSNTYPVAKNSTASYEIYNSSYGLYISEYTAPDASTATVTVDMTTPTYNTISLNTGVSGLTAIVTIDDIDYSLTETGNTGIYTINLYKTLSGSVSVNYLVSGGSSYADASGTLTFNNNDISETITLTPAQDITFTRPDLTANGTMGGDSFAVRSGTLTSAWRAVDSSSTSYANISSSSSYTFEFYNPKALKVSQLDFSFSYTNYASTDIVIEGSNDDSTWKQINTWSGAASTSLTFTVNSSVYYKYHRLIMTPAGTGSRAYIRINDLAITAVYKG